MCTCLHGATAVTRWPTIFPRAKRKSKAPPAEKRPHGIPMKVGEIVMSDNFPGKFSGQDVQGKVLKVEVGKAAEVRRGGRILCVQSQWSRNVLTKLYVSTKELGANPLPISCYALPMLVFLMWLVRVLFPSPTRSRWTSPSAARWTSCASPTSSG